MQAEVLKSVLLEYRKLALGTKLIPRNYFKLEDSLNYVFVGPRRAGKSFYMYYIAQRLVATKQYAAEDILYVNFEDDRLTSITVDELSEILYAYNSEYPEQKPVVFLDEVQIVDKWEKFARRLADQFYRVYVSGSNARLLSHDIATTLGGRYTVKEITPFSFKEFLEYKGVKLPSDWYLDNQLKARVRNLFKDYFNYGGFPEVAKIEAKREWLSAHRQRLLLADVAARNELRNYKTLELMVKKLADSVMQPSSLTRVSNLLTAAGYKIARATVGEYIDMLEEAYVVFCITNYTDGFSDRKLNRKTYFSDNGLFSGYLCNGQTKLLENQVAVELRRRYALGQPDALYYFNRNVEVDFYLPGESLAVQVSYDVDDDLTLKRELGAFEKLTKVYETENLLLITYDQSAEYTLKNGQKVRTVPVWRWLLG